MNEYKITMEEVLDLALTQAMKDWAIEIKNKLHNPENKHARELEREAWMKVEAIKKLMGK